MAVDPDALQEILADFAHADGRAAYAVIRTPHWSWSGGEHADDLLPAASLLKLAIGMALEPRLDDLNPQRPRDLLLPGDVSILHALDPDHVLSARELHALMLSASDAPSARWATGQVGLAAIQEAVLSCGATRTEAVSDDNFGVLGHTTAREAVDLMRAASDVERFPASARALQHSITNSRIPLGVTADDITQAHKTGTLTGVAHDVAYLTCSGGDVWLAFLSAQQHDTLVTGYDMGLATQALLECVGLQATSTRSVLGGSHRGPGG